MDFEAEVRLILQRLDTLTKYIEEDRKSMKDHIDTSQSFRDKVIALEAKTAAHDNIFTYYNWILGIIIAIGIAMLGKMYL